MQRVQFEDLPLGSAGVKAAKRLAGWFVIGLAISFVSDFCLARLNAQDEVRPKSV